MNNDYISSGRIRQLSFLAILIILGWILFRELQSFMPALLGAITLYVIMRKWMLRLVQVRKWKPGLAAATLMNGATRFALKTRDATVLITPARP